MTAPVALSATCKPLSPVFSAAAFAASGVAIPGFCSSMRFFHADCCARPFSSRRSLPRRRADPSPNHARAITSRHAASASLRSSALAAFSSFCKPPCAPAPPVVRERPRLRRDCRPNSAASRSSAVISSRMSLRSMTPFTRSRRSFAAPSRRSTAVVLAPLCMLGSRLPRLSANSLSPRSSAAARCSASVLCPCRQRSASTG